MTAVDLNTTAQSFAEHLPVCLAGGMAVVLLAWSLLRLTARHNARVRFQVWFSALVAITAFLLLGGIQFRSTDATLTSPAGHALFDVPAKWALYAFVVWAILASAALLRVAVGLWHVYRLRNSCIEIDVSTIDPVLMDCIKTAPTRCIAICVSDRVSAPTALGFARPAVVIPAWLMKELSTDELKQVLLHEMAHLQRWDDWTNLAQKVLRALLIFHPVVWWLDSKLTLEREMACDDMVLRRTENPNAYARCLAALAEKSFARRSIIMAQAAVSRVRQTSARVSRILNLPRPADVPVWTSALSLLALFGFAGLLLSHAPNVVAFDDHATQTLGQQFAVNESHPLHALARPVAFHPANVAQTQRASAPIKSFAATSTRKSAIPVLNRTELAHHRPVRTESRAAAEVTPVKFVPQSHQSRAVVGANRPDVVRDGAIVERAVFVVVDPQQNGAPALMWQVTFWRVTMTAQTAAPAATIPKTT
jgi:beta-lactamase regulating signal transducer with metallopeptidase domain